MKKGALFFMLFLLTSPFIFTQENPELLKDSLSVNGTLGLRGRWQTGNLNQVSIMPSAGISFSNNSQFTTLNATYHYLKVGDFNAINDFWTYALHQYQPNRRVFPSAHAIMGFAKSYKIDHSIVAGVGGGMNIHKKSPADFLQLHLYGAYLDFKYEAENLHQAFAIGSLIRANIPLSDHINFRWELSTFHSIQDETFWGGGNSIQLNFKLIKNLMLNINHQTYYNNQTASGIEKTNTEMLFGIQYQFTK